MRRLAVPAASIFLVLACASPDRGSGPGAVSQPVLREQLLQLKAEDVAARQAVIAGDFKDKEANRRLDEADARHLPVLRSIVDRHGWPSRSLVGADGAEAAWLLVQHADTDPVFQERCLALIEPLVAAGEVALSEHAYLVDRVRVNRGRPQVYGTQVREVPGGWEPQPVEDPEHLDARRREAGLPPIAEYLRTIRE